MPRSLVTIDLGAIRWNARTLAARVAPAELWAVVKADGYGHGATPASHAALDGGASALCVATVAEGVELRGSVAETRIIVLGPTADEDVRAAREASLEVTATDERIPDGLPVHLKLDTGMGRWGLSELVSPPRTVVGFMSHLATSESDRGFAREQLGRFLEATAPYAGRAVRHIANSAAALDFPEARLDAVRCGIALYGIDPYGRDAARFQLRPALRWESDLEQVKCLGPGESTGYGRRFVATAETWIGIVPVGYADGFRRDLSGTEILVAGEPAPVIGTVSMDAVAVRLSGRLERGTPVTLVGDGVTLEQHAQVAGTIAYELACGIRTSPGRGTRVTRDD